MTHILPRSLRISVADDEPDMRRYFSQMLPRLGHQVISVASTGKELLLHCRNFSPDLVITDIKMPDMDGLEAAKIILQEAPRPLLLVSACHAPDYGAYGIEEDALAYLQKPIKLAHLSPAITQAQERFERHLRRANPNRDR